MRIDIITLFPDFFEGLRTHSIVGRAIGTGAVELVTHNLRQWSHDAYQSVDDHPYGGGSGMVLRVDVVAPAILDVKKLNPTASVILTTPQGEVYSQKTARVYSQSSGLIIVCGHYEGFDERIREYVDQEISIGDYVLTGGEIPAMIILDSVVRLLPGVLGDDHSSVEESHSDGLLEYPQYTRPPVYEDKKVPDILLSGNHPQIEKWRAEQSRERTKKRRPDLLQS
jgi:tRNA (guanine37-N1)-methyltransferase